MFEKFIADQNPHWDGKPMEAGFPRFIISALKQFINSRQIVALIGVRRCGKSTAAKQLINHLICDKKVNPKNILFLNLESPFLSRFRDNPLYLQNIFDEYSALALPKGKIYIFLDEVQFFSDWQVFVKSLYEKGGIKFVITGSNSSLLSSEMATMLSGRSIAKNIFPFSFKEILTVKKVDIQTKLNIIKNERQIRHFFSDYLRSGGFPEIVLEKNSEMRNEILINYYRNILYQDIIPRFEIKKTKEIENLLLYLFSNIGQSYSYNSLSDFLKIRDKTVKEYIGFFEKSFLLTEVSNFQYSLKKQENYPKKVYSIDNGFINAVSFSFSENFGRFLENAVFIDLLERNKKVYYHKGNLECDFLIKEKMKITEAIQVTKELAQTNEKREFGGLLEALDKFSLKTGWIITENQEDKRKIGDKTIEITPIWKWLLRE